MQRSSLLRLGLALVVALLVVVPTALAAEELDREEYVKRVDLICKMSEKTNSRILNGVERQVRKGKLGPAARRVLRASRSFGRSVVAIAKVPRPAADNARLTTWIRQLHAEKSLLQTIGVALKQGKKGRANHLAVQLQSATRHAKNTVFSFEFTYCDREVRIS
jgi:hypothetical protein